MSPKENPPPGIKFTPEEVCLLSYLLGGYTVDYIRDNPGAVRPMPIDVREAGRIVPQATPRFDVRIDRRLEELLHLQRKLAAYQCD